MKETPERRRGPIVAWASVAAADANGTEVGDAELSEIIVNAMPFIGEEESIPLEYILFLTPRRLRTR